MCEYSKAWLTVVSPDVSVLRVHTYMLCQGMLAGFSPH